MQRIRKDDRVAVIAGKDRGKQGRVVKVYVDRDRALVEGVNYVKKHQRVQQGGAGQEGGIIQTEAPIHMSNIMPVCPSCDAPVRVGFELTDPADARSKTRVCKKCGSHF
jgi:large subunit ribosomal protein L24